MTPASSTQAATTQHERRREIRYPAVGIQLLYSLLEDRVLDDLGDILLKASTIDMSLSGLSFEVKEPLALGAQLVLIVHNLHQRPAERLIAEVCWCRPSDDGHFCIGAQIKHSVKLEEHPEELAPVYDVQHGAAYPSELAMTCPACQQDTSFLFVAIQPIPHASIDALPLYDCSQCGTTRSITSLLTAARISSSSNTNTKNTPSR